MKTVNLIKGVHLLKTMQSAKRRSLPKVQVSPYLDLYVLTAEKERVLKEEGRLCMRIDAVKRRLREIDIKINKLKEEGAAIKNNDDASLSQERKGWKKILLGY